MKKSLRNLILSLFLAAGIAACEGERGPIGEAGPAGAAGAEGAKGAAGDAGKSSEEIPSAYEFLKTWGKPDGTAACSDDIFKKTEAFPGPAALAKAAESERVPIGTLVSNTFAFPTIELSADPPVPATDKGKCSAELFGDKFPFGFGKPGMFLRSEKMKETPKRGKTPVLDNPTLATTERQFWGGQLVVDLKDSAVEIGEMDRLAVRCDVGERPVADAPDAPAGSKRISGEYRIALTTETENILGKDAGGSTVIKDSDPNTAANDYELINYTTQVCFRLDSVPGTVKCYVRMSVQERNATDDTKKGGATPTRKVTERIALYKGGKLTQVMPMPYSNGLLAGEKPSSSNNFPFNIGPTAHAPAAANLDSVGKLCNFFDNGVIPCLSGEVPNDEGTCG